MPAKRLLLIVNPVAGKMRSKSIFFSIVDVFCRQGYRVTTVITSRRDDARTATEELAAEQDLIVCCGGDGTLNETLNGLISCRADVPFGYIPAGSTNDFANSLHLSFQPETAVRAILSGREDALDAGDFDGRRYFSYIASFGAFTATSYSVPQATKNVLGYLAYVLEGIKELSAIKSTAVRVETEDRFFDGEYLFGAVCNSTSVGGLVKLNAGAVDMSDGLFECILIRQPKNGAEFHKIITSLNTSNFDNEMFDFIKASRLTFRMGEPLPWSLDGEYVAGGTCVTVTNCHRAVRLRH